MIPGFGVIPPTIGYEEWARCMTSLWFWYRVLLAKCTLEVNDAAKEV